jgi:hypothetical protein
MTAEPDPSVVRLYRPTGQAERDLVEASGWLAWPPRLPEQPIFYPVLNEWYATKIAREWNVPHAGVGYVMEFDVDAAYLERFAVQQVGGRDVLELWVPAEESEEFNAHIVGRIRMIARYDAVGDYN